MNTSSPNANPNDSSAKRRWHVYAIDDIIEELRTDPELGLTASEASRRLEEFGPNRVETGKDTPWYQILLRQFLDPLIYLLLFAASVAFVFGKITDTLVILAVLVINATIGFVQEMRARKAIRSLTQMAAPQAIVVRDGLRREIPSEEVVPGDLVQLEAGRSIPADLRLARAEKLAVDESALTGESTLVEKHMDTLDDEDLVPGDQSNMAFSTTVVGRGQGQGIAVATAQNTELGHIATSLQDITEEKAPVQQKVHTLGKWIGLAIASLSILVATVGWIQARTLDDIVSMIIAMTVAAIPEALPVVLTVTLAVGVRRMAERNAIIRSLPAVETLGSTTVIGSDKTGTLTMNQMTVKMVYAGEELFEVTGSGYAPRGEFLLDGQGVEDISTPLRYTLLAGILANDVERLPDEDEAQGGDPTEIALVVSAQKLGLDPADSRRAYPRKDVIPFESERQFMATLNHTDQGLRKFFKGAPEAILARCSRAMAHDGTADELDEQLITNVAHDLARQGLRILAMAYGDTSTENFADEDNEDLIFLGFQALEDPLRPEVKEAVRKTRQAGLRVLMLTGDHLDTARAIGEQLGLQEGDDDPAIEGRAIESLSDEELRQIIRQKSIYARVSPNHKLRIVEQLKSDGEIVAVTGDGVNDAPALRAAHLGVAMGKSGTDVAREASDMILTDDNFGGRGNLSRPPLTT